MTRLLMITVMVATLSAADLSDWKNLDALKAGDRVGVVQSNMKRVEGVLGGVSESGVTVDGTLVAKGEVVRVYRRAGLSRLTRTLIGAGLGVGVGALISQTAGKRFENEGAKFGGIEDAGWYAIGIGAGAGLGASTGSGYQTIYQRK
jgi:hypothetical protein